MNAFDFLYSSLEKLSENFPKVYIKYAYNNIINTHIVELLPLEEYNNNAALDDAWIPLSFKFRETFPADEISFVSSDSTLSIDNPSFEFNTPRIPCIGDLSAIYEPISQKEFNYSFPEFMPAVAVAISTSVTDVLNSPKQEIDTESDMSNNYQAAA